MLLTFVLEAQMGPEWSYLLGKFQAAERHYLTKQQQQ